VVICIRENIRMVSSTGMASTSGAMEAVIRGPLKTD